jgi:hypothetical protein
MYTLRYVLYSTTSMSVQYVDVFYYSTTHCDVASCDKYRTPQHCNVYRDAARFNHSGLMQL